MENKVNVGLVVFADQKVLLEKRGNVYGIPEATLPNYRTSLYIINELIARSTYITGSWVEFELGLKQIGVFDDLNRNPTSRELIIVYSLMIPSDIRLKEGYEWSPIDRLSDKTFYLDHENIVRCAAIGDIHYKR